MSSFLVGWPAFLIFLGVTLTAIGGLLGAINQNESDKALRIQNEKISKQNSEITQRNESIANLLNKVSKSITGGDSYLSFSLHYNKETKKIDVSAIVEGGQANIPGKYSLSNLTIEIKNADGSILQNYKDHEAHLSVVSQFKPLDVPNDLEYKYCHIVVFAKNGQYGQHFLLKKNSKGTWYTHTIKFNDLHNVELREENFDSDYPEQLKKKEPVDALWKKKLITQEDGSQIRKQFRAQKNDETYYGL